MNCSPESQAAVPTWRPLVHYELPKEIQNEGEKERERERGIEVEAVGAAVRSCRRASPLICCLSHLVKIALPTRCL